jgi:hypothetical protein
VVDPLVVETLVVVELLAVVAAVELVEPVCPPFPLVPVVPVVVPPPFGSSRLEHAKAKPPITRKYIARRCI